MAKRSSNFTTFEKETVVSLVGEYSQIIEDKRTDSRSNREKEKVWSEITTKFNSEINNSSKTTKQLQSCWKNIKIKAKKAATCSRQEKFRMGGGPKPQSPTIEDRAVEAIIQDKYEPLHNQYDDDFVPGENDGTSAPDAATIPAVHSQNTSTPVEASTPSSPQPSTSSRRPILSTRNFRKTTVPTKRKQIGEMAAVIKMRRVEHKIKMNNYKREREIVEDEHEMKMEILQLKLRYSKVKLDRLIDH